MTRYERTQRELRKHPGSWLVTGAAGFIGSHLVEKLLSLDQAVVGLDNLATGKRKNLAEIRARIPAEQWERFRFIEGDICRPKVCREACRGVDFVLHEAALGSVPRSLEKPLRSHASNVDGFVNMLVTARGAGVKRFIYASSSSIYGDNPTLPKIETDVGRPLSPYAATKMIDEIYAEVFHRSYGLPVIGLRYFNVFGPRQDPKGAYAAVIPKWFAAALHNEPICINGDGESSRDFCFIDNVVQANLLAAMTDNQAAIGRAYNVAFGGRTTLNQLCTKIRAFVADRCPGAAVAEPVFGRERAGDVRHSHADIRLARELLGYDPECSVDEGLAIAGDWYLQQRQAGGGSNRPPASKSAAT